MLNNKSVASIIFTFVLYLYSSLLFSQEESKVQAGENLRQPFMEFGYDDAEAGFNGIYLGGMYNYDLNIDLVGEAAFLRGHNINHSHIFIGARYFLPIEIGFPIRAAARGGLVRASFEGDEEFGVLLGARLHYSTISDKLSIETGLDYITAGENDFVWVLGARYQFTDKLYFHSKYWKTDLDELTIGVGIKF